MLILSEDQKLLMASARGAVAEKEPITEFRNLRADPNSLGFSPAFWRASAELGWTGVLVPEAFGGLDFGVVGAGLIAREMARELALSPFLSTSVLSASALARAGSREQNGDWLPRIARGEAIVAFALDEGSRHGAIATMATRTGGGWRLDGVKQFVLDGHAADAMLIAAKTGDEAALFLATADTAGLSRDARTLVDGRRVATITLDGVLVGADARLEGGAATIEEVVDIGRAVISAALCGVAEEAFARTARISRNGASSIAGSAASKRFSIAPRACISRSRTPGRRRFKRYSRSRRAPIPSRSTSRSPRPRQARRRARRRPSACRCMAASA